MPNKRNSIDVDEISVITRRATHSKFKMCGDKFRRLLRCTLRIQYKARRLFAVRDWRLLERRRDDAGL